MRLAVRLLVSAIFLTTLTVAAHADTFALTNYIFQSGATATGTIDIDTTTGTVISTDIAYSALPTDPFNISNGIGIVSLGLYTNAPSLDAVGDTLADSFHTPANGFVGYTGGATCSETDPCDPGGIPDSSAIIFVDTALAPDQLETGSLTLVPSSTPEPSSLALFSTGILGLAGAARCRSLRLK